MALTNGCVLSTLRGWVCLTDWARYKQVMICGEQLCYHIKCGGWTPSTTFPRSFIATCAKEACKVGQRHYGSVFVEVGEWLGAGLRVRACLVHGNTNEDTKFSPASAICRCLQKCGGEDLQRHCCNSLAGSCAKQ